MQRAKGVARARVEARVHLTHEKSRLQIRNERGISRRKAATAGRVLAGSARCSSNRIAGGACPHTALLVSQQRQYFHKFLLRSFAVPYFLDAVDGGIAFVPMARPLAGAPANCLCSFTSLQGHK